MLGCSKVEVAEVLLERLRRSVFGQRQAIEEIVDTLAERIERPRTRGSLASFLFVGPEGSGRIAAAQAIALSLFGKEELVEEMPLAAYSESHTVSSLIGAPPGYVGHTDGGVLAGLLSRKPFVVLVWLDVDKAHEVVLDFLTQVLERGVVTDRRGRRLDFRNAVNLLLPSQDVVEELRGGEGVGFGRRSSENSTKRVREVLKGVLPPGLLKAVDRIVLFRKPGAEEQVQDVRAAIESIVRRLERRTGASFEQSLDLAEKLVVHARETGEPLNLVLKGFEDGLEGFRALPGARYVLDVDGMGALLVKEANQ